MPFNLFVISFDVSRKASKGAKAQKKFSGYCLLVVLCISLSIINYQLSSINYQLSTFNFHLKILHPRNLSLHIKHILCNHPFQPPKQVHVTGCMSGL